MNAIFISLILMAGILLIHVQYVPIVFREGLQAFWMRGGTLLTSSKILLMFSLISCWAVFFSVAVGIVLSLSLAMGHAILASRAAEQLR